MSLDSMYDARRFTTNARLMSRIALIFSGDEYPYSDRDKVISQAKKFLTIALEEGHFLGNGSEIDVYESHYDPLQPFTLSAKVLDTGNSLSNDIADLEEKLESILQSIKSIEDGIAIEPKENLMSRKFFTSLKDSFNALANDKLLENVTSKAPELLALNGYT